MGIFSLYAIAITCSLLSPICCTDVPQPVSSGLPPTCLGNLARRASTEEGNYCNPGEFIEVEFKLQFGCDSVPAYIDQGIRFDAWENKELHPIRFITPTLKKADASLVRLLDDSSVQTEDQILPLLLLNTTEPVTIREYLCGGFVSQLSDKGIRLRWKQRSLTKYGEGIATWYLDDVTIRLWRGGCMVKVLSDGFNVGGLSSGVPGIDYFVKGGDVSASTCNNAGSVMNFDRQPLGRQPLGKYIFRRSFVITIRDYKMEGCDGAGIVNDAEMFSSRECPVSNLNVNQNVSIQCSHSSVVCGCDKTESVGVGMTCQGSPPPTTEVPPTTTEALPTTTEPPLTTTEPPPNNIIIRFVP